MPDSGSAAHELAARIDKRGPIPLSEYMAVANQYYYASKDPLGEDGDFVTAPEVSQMFGEMIGLWLVDLWIRKQSPESIHYVELGPGRGTLADDAFRVIAKYNCKPQCHFVETSPVLKAKQAELHPDATWHEDVETLPEDGPLMIVANEFFDALPIEQYIKTSAGWRQHVVARERNKFVAVPGIGSAADRVALKNDQFPGGTILESSPASVDVMGDLCNRLAKQGGVLLLIDYGYDEPGTGSTLQAVKDHLPVNPFDSPGASDLTAHVNFLELANVARTRLMTVHGPTEQGQWLKAIGIDQRSEKLCEAAPGHAEAIRSGHHRLTHLDEMGRLFKVMAATSMDWPEPEGFVYRDEETLA